MYRTARSLETTEVEAYGCLHYFLLPFIAQKFDFAQ